MRSSTLPSPCVAGLFAVVPSSHRHAHRIRASCRSCCALQDTGLRLPPDLGEGHHAPGSARETVERGPALPRPWIRKTLDRGKGAGLSTWIHQRCRILETLILRPCHQPPFNSLEGLFGWGGDLRPWTRERHLGLEEGSSPWIRLRPFRGQGRQQASAPGLGSWIPHCGSHTCTHTHTHTHTQTHRVTGIGGGRVLKLVQLRLQTRRRTASPAHSTSRSLTHSLTPAAHTHNQARADTTREGGRALVLCVDLAFKACATQTDKQRRTCVGATASELKTESTTLEVLNQNSPGPCSENSCRTDRDGQRSAPRKRIYVCVELCSSGKH